MFLNLGNSVPLKPVLGEGVVVGLGEGVGAYAALQTTLLYEESHSNRDSDFHSFVHVFFVSNGNLIDLILFLQTVATQFLCCSSSLFACPLL